MVPKLGLHTILHNLNPINNKILGIDFKDSHVEGNAEIKFLEQLAINAPLLVIMAL